MKVIVILVFALVVAAILVLAPQNADASEWDLLVPDAAGVMIPMDGGIEATQLECASWNVATALDRRVWLDLIEPVTDFGAGASIDITPGGAACIGVGKRDVVFGYAGLHGVF